MNILLNNLTDNIYFSKIKPSKLLQILEFSYHMGSNIFQNNDPLLGTSLSELVLSPIVISLSTNYNINIIKDDLLYLPETNQEFAEKLNNMCVIYGFEEILHLKQAENIKQEEIELPIIIIYNPKKEQINNVFGFLNNKLLVAKTFSETTKNRLKTYCGIQNPKDTLLVNLTNVIIDTENSWFIKKIPNLKFKNIHSILKTSSITEDIMNYNKLIDTKGIYQIINNYLTIFESTFENTLTFKLPKEKKVIQYALSLFKYILVTLTLSSKQLTENNITTILDLFFKKIFAQTYSDLATFNSCSFNKKAIKEHGKLLIELSPFISTVPNSA